MPNKKKMMKYQSASTDHIMIKANIAAVHTTTASPALRFSVFLAHPTIRRVLPT